MLDSVGKNSIEELFRDDTLEIRQLLGQKANDNGWYKRIDHGEYIGKLWLESLPELKDKTLESEYKDLINWIQSSV